MPASEPDREADTCFHCRWLLIKGIVVDLVTQKQGWVALEGTQYRVYEVFLLRIPYLGVHVDQGEF